MCGSLKNNMKTFNFNHNPTFAELWDVCVYNLLYKIEDYKIDVEKLFSKIGVTKESNIIDVSSGSGFPSLELLEDGYKVTCVDGFIDEVELFNEKARRKNIKSKSVQILWNNLPKSFNKESFDFLFCRGNSFIYAGGGWNTMIDIDKENSLKNYKSTLKIFYDLLKPGGWIYVDKFKDSETTHREKVCEIKINSNIPEELIFWTERYPKQKIRQASMIRKVGDIENKTPNITYDLNCKELELFLADTGFKNIQKIKLPSEKHFDVWIAQK